MTNRLIAFGALSATLLFTSCKKDETAPTLRDKVDYNSLTATTAYPATFKDKQGRQTVDFRANTLRLDMFSQLDTYMKRVTLTTPSELQEGALHAMYQNLGNAFSVDSLNTSGVSLSEKAALSTGTSAQYNTWMMDSPMRTLAVASRSVNAAASAGQPGRLGKYLLDADGIEQGQYIQKGLIGAWQIDQICNTLLSESALNADNSAPVEGKTYTALEHNWDMAYGVLTSRPVFGGMDSLGEVRERFLGSYMREFNAAGVPKVHMAFLKGRAAIANGDMTTMKAQADLIRTELELAIAKSAIGYLDGKVKTAADRAASMHALAEGLGFVHALRFCKTKAGVDAAWSDSVLNALLSGPNKAWDVDNAKLDAAAAAIRAKFSL